MSGEWHVGLPCPTREGQLGVVLGVGKMIYSLPCFDLCCFTFNGPYLMIFADRHTTEPNFSLVNRVSLENILKVEVFVNEDNYQLKAAHLILGYTPISRAFQAPKCVIKAHNPCLHRICVAVEGFLLPEGALIPEGIPLVSPSSSRPVVEEKNEKAEKKEKVVELGLSEEEFEVFK